MKLLSMKNPERVNSLGSFSLLDFLCMNYYTANVKQ